MPGISREDGKISRGSSGIRRECCCEEDPEDWPDTDPGGNPVPPPRTGSADCCECRDYAGEACTTLMRTASQCAIKGAISNPDAACFDVGGGLVGKVTDGTPNHAYACDTAAPDILAVCGCGAGGWLIDPGGIEVSYYTDGLCEAGLDHTEHELEVDWEVYWDNSVPGGYLEVTVIAASGGNGAWFGRLQVFGSTNCRGPHIVPYVNPLAPGAATDWFINGSARVTMCDPLDPVDPLTGCPEV